MSVREKRRQQKAVRRGWTGRDLPVSLSPPQLPVAPAPAAHTASFDMRAGSAAPRPCAPCPACSRWPDDEAVRSPEREARKLGAVQRLRCSMKRPPPQRPPSPSCGLVRAPGIPPSNTRRRDRPSTTAHIDQRHCTACVKRAEALQRRRGMRRGARGRHRLFLHRLTLPVRWALFRSPPCMHRTPAS